METCRRTVKEVPVTDVPLSISGSSCRTVGGDSITYQPFLGFTWIRVVRHHRRPVWRLSGVRRPGSGLRDRPSAQVILSTALHMMSSTTSQTMSLPRNVCAHYERPNQAVDGSLVVVVEEADASIPNHPMRWLSLHPYVKNTLLPRPEGGTPQGKDPLQ